MGCAVAKGTGGACSARQVHCQFDDLLLLFETGGAEPASSFSASLIVLLRSLLHGAQYSCQLLMLLLDGTVEVGLVAALFCLKRVGESLRA